MPENTPNIPLPDFHPEEPQLGPLYPEAPGPLQELPNPGESLPIPRPSTQRIDIADALSRNNFQAIADQSFDPSFLVQPVRYDDESYNRLQKTFDNPDRDNLFSKVGFYPGVNNEDRFAKSLSKWQKVGLAWDQMWGLSKETFQQQWATETQFWGNLASGQLKNAFLPFSNKEELENMSRTMDTISSSNYIPLTYEEQTGHFGFGKFATGLGQFGFTLGTIGAFSTQLGLEVVATALLAPETGGGSILGFGASLANKAKRALTVAEFFEKLKQAENTVETAGKIRRAWNYLSDSQNIKKGFGTFYSFTKQWNAAAGEAKFEAGSSYTEYIDKKFREATDSGKILTYEERQQIEGDASKVAMNNGITNTGLLYVMNRINMANVFRGPFSAQKRFLTEFGKMADEGLIKTAKGWVPKYAAGMFSKETAKGIPGKILRWGLDSAWEGVQEVAQGVSNKYWQTYYNEQYDRNPNFDKLSLVGKSISARLDSNESFDEFVSGFIIGVPGSAINMGLGKFHSNVLFRNQDKAAKEQLNKLASELNKWEADPTKVFDPRVANVNNQMLFSQEIEEAIKSDNLYAFKNLNNQHLRDTVMLGLRTGKLDYMIDTLKDQIKNLKPDEFEALFKVADDATNRKSAVDYVNLLEQKAKSIAEDYDKTKQKYANPFSNFSSFKPGSEEETNAKIRYVAWENAVQDLVFQRDTHKNVVKRMGDILGDAKDNIGAGLYNTFFTVTSTESIDREMAMLKTEIDSLKANTALDDQAKKLLAQKQAQYNGLKRWSNSFSLVGDMLEKREDFVASLAEHTDEGKAALKEVLQAYQMATPGAEELTSEQIDNAHQSIIDYARLNNDNKRVVRNISFLTDANNFVDHFDRHYIQAQEFYKNEMIRRTEKVIQRQALMQALEDDDMFASQPVVQTLIARIEVAIKDRDFEDIEALFDAVEDEYRKFYKPAAPAAPATPTGPESLNHTVREEADGTFTVLTPKGNIAASGIKTREEAEEMAANMDEALSTGPAPVTTAPAPGTSEPALLRVYKNRIKSAKDVPTLNKVQSQLEKEGLKKGLSQDMIDDLIKLIQDKVEEIAKNRSKNAEAEQKIIDTYMNKINNTYTIPDSNKLLTDLFDINSDLIVAVREGILSQENFDAIQKAMEERVLGIRNGTIQAPAKITVAEMKAKIDKATKENIMDLKAEIEKEFDGKEKDDLLAEVVDKMNKFAEEQKAEEDAAMNNIIDTSNIDNFDVSEFDDQLNDIAGVKSENEKSETPTEPESDDPAKDDLFTSICP